MPSTITHAYFGLDVYNKLSNKTKKNISPYIEQLKTFAQGPDVFYFYNSINVLKGKKINKLGHYMHKHKSKDFFINMITYIKDNHLEEDYEIITYLYGSICHYVLDYTAHPFIFYKTGVVKKSDKNTYKYAGLHNDMEAYIDAYYIYDKENINPKNFKIHEYALNTNHFSPSLSKMIDYIFDETYNTKNISNIYLKSIKKMRTLYYLLRYDPSGIKKYFYKLINIFIFNPLKKKKAISYNINPTDKIAYLNLDKKPWNNPTDNIIVNYSFPELYNIAIDNAVNIISKVNNVLYDNFDFKYLDEIFLNLSYCTGKDCNLNLKMKYFEK